LTADPAYAGAVGGFARWSFSEGGLAALHAGASADKAVDRKNAPSFKRYAFSVTRLALRVTLI